MRKFFLREKEKGRCSWGEECLEVGWRELCDFLGISEYEAKAYLCLVQRGVLNARNLSFAACVPRTKIYAVLERLSELGLVSKRRGTPAKFSPCSPAKAFKDRLAECRERTDRLSRLVYGLEDAFSKNGRPVPLPPPSPRP